MTKFTATFYGETHAAAHALAKAFLAQSRASIITSHESRSLDGDETAVTVKYEAPDDHVLPTPEQSGRSQR